MTYQRQDIETLSAVERVAERGLRELPDAVAALINEAMRVERDHPLGAGRYERSDDRRGYANGYKTRTMKARIGALALVRRQLRVRAPGALDCHPAPWGFSTVGVAGALFSLWRVGLTDARISAWRGVRPGRYWRG